MNNDVCIGRNMLALDRFLDEQSKTFDFEKIFSADIKSIDETSPPLSVYKYYPAARSAFFSDPTFRFTQRAALNDPFEFTRRWTDFASKAAQKAFSDHLRETMCNFGRNKALILEMLKNDSIQKGIFLSDEQLRKMREYLDTRDGEEGIRLFVESAVKQIDPLLISGFGRANAGFDAFLNKFGAEYGVFSTSESAINQQLWGLYADSGRGFCVELNTGVDFLRAANGRALLWKVKYTDEILEGFLTNPFFLFLVKSQNWSFEQEWRTIRKLSDCEVAVGPNKDVHLMHAKPGLIRAINFGYSYDESRWAVDAAAMIAFDPNIIIRRAYIDPNSRQIAFHHIVPK